MTNFMDKIIILTIIMTILFSAVVLFINYRDHVVSDSLIIGWFAFWGTELVGMVSIQNKKPRKEE